jgi:hypothetical protein
MAIILHLAEGMDDDPPDPALPTTGGPAPPIYALSPLVAVPTVDEATTHVALAAVVDCPTNAAHVAAWTTSCPPARRQTTHS